MKVRNIKKLAKKSIISGWRQYIELKFTYETLGLDRKDFISEKELFQILKLKPQEESTGFVDHYRGYDMRKIHENIPMLVGFNIDSVHSKEATEYDYHKGKYFHEHEGVFYYMEGYAGYVNPNNEIEGEEYWLFGGTDKERHEWILSKKSISDKEKELLRKYGNNKEFGHDMYGSCNEKYDKDTKEWIITNKYNELCEVLCELSQYNKTNYYTFTDTHVHICYAIRYRDYVEDFLRDLKKLVKTHKLKNNICKQKDEN